MESSNGGGNPDEAVSIPAQVFLALTTTKLLIASRLVDALINGPGPSIGILGSRLAGEAFKEIARAIDQTIGGEVDDSWARLYEMFANAYRDAYVASSRDPSEGATSED
ncbi:MAG: hypothetical protein ACE5IZ_01405 [Dehalococcoidia bacterium]